MTAPRWPLAVAALLAWNGPHTGLAGVQSDLGIVEARLVQLYANRGYRVQGGGGGGQIHSFLSAVAMPHC